jgi:hypothetical protein
LVSIIRPEQLLDVRGDDHGFDHVEGHGCLVAASGEERVNGPGRMLARVPVADVGSKELDEAPGRARRRRRSAQAVASRLEFEE